MDYFLAKQKPKPLTQDKLLALFKESEAKAKENSKNQPGPGFSSVLGRKNEGSHRKKQ